MEYVYGALLLHSAGKEINEKNVKKVIDATGEKVDDAQVKALVAALKDVNIEEAISKAAMPVAAPAEAAPAGEAKVEEKKEEPEEDKEKKEEEAAEGLAGLFG
jgi:large subunit ribosomal protein L12